MNNIERIMSKQADLNEHTVKGWLRKNLEFDRALRQEAAEAMDSLPWKWWKKSESDFDNLAVEAIDMLHFAASMCLQDQISDFSWLDKRLRSVCDEHNTFQLSDSSGVVKSLAKKIDSIVLNSFRPDGDAIDAITDVVALLGMLGFTYDYIVKAYLTKNVLNGFRNDNGYREGTYIKDWFGNEDNVFAFQIAKEMSLSGNFEDEIYAELAKKYEEVKNEASK